MSHNDATSSAAKQEVQQQLRAPRMRTLRKELLLARADVERMELRQATHELRDSVAHLPLIGSMLVPGSRPARRSVRSTSPRGTISGVLDSLLGRGGAGKYSFLFKQYPVVGSLASLLLTKPVRTRLLRSAKPLIKWGGLGLAAWEGWRIWQQMKTTSVETSTDAVDPTVF
ncbi:DUF3318 domain-containing protein [Caballeronia sp. LZ062]|uniref:DUF3318 domain-containing protein n=1 Tax=unclassified Caballeronia TaxID=2646786 RepID=UPI00286034B5|nr:MULTISPECIES: DUF3318 domain-containing protein [unclassified Caballeronia]MDR5855325.1 DUF3318 domain-containing protein [Caballeronia sp. LZ050]MDR5870146.1 DUF3318 domain-containing protein [Caballeronia sp. LZ062]